MDPRSVRLDPGGERYFARLPMGYRDRPAAEAHHGSVQPQGWAPGGYVRGRAEQLAGDNDTCRTCGARRVFGCEHLS
jgi:hypothetical protein